MKRLLPLLFVTLFLSCTARDWQSINRTFSRQRGHYFIEMYSGGDAVYKDEFIGTINQEEGTDGIFYTKGDTLIELSGDYVIKQTKY